MSTSERKYILFDTETTGIEEDDRIIQVGAMVVSQNGSVQVFDELCTPTNDKAIPFEAMEVHNITPKMIQNKPKYAQTNFKMMLDELNNENSYLIAHNLPFDLKMVEKEGFECKMKCIDTLRCSRHIYPNEKHHRLQYLRYSLGLYKQEEQEAITHNITIKAHDAIGDVLVMKLLLDDMIQEIKTLKPNADVIDELVRLTKQPALLTRMSFGKYKGELFSEIAKKDMSYLDWVLSQKGFSENEDLIYTVGYYVKGTRYGE